MPRVILYTVKPVLRDHGHERSPVLKDHKVLSKGVTFQYNLNLSLKTTCLERPYPYDQWGLSFKTGSTVREMSALKAVSPIGILGLPVYYAHPL